MKFVPIFEYECLNCGVNFEKKVSFGYEGIPACPRCEANDTKKLISAPGIIFKGQGFYKNEGRSCSEKEQEKKCDTCPLKKDSQSKS